MNVDQVGLLMRTGLCLGCSGARRAVYVGLGRQGMEVQSQVVVILTPVMPRDGRKGISPFEPLVTCCPAQAHTDSQT